MSYLQTTQQNDFRAKPESNTVEESGDDQRIGGV
jgi:hypothetical protein